MIESRYWRAELRRDVAWLRTRQRYRRWSEKQQILFERRIMVVAFQIRVLLERPKVSVRARRTTVSSRVYPKVGKRTVHWLNAAELHEHFDLDNFKVVELSMREVCNQLIHHYIIFAARGEQTRFESILVFSDYKRNICLYELPVKELLDAFGVFASEQSAPYNDPEVRFRWDEKRQDYIWEETPDADNEAPAT